MPGYNTVVYSEQGGSLQRFESTGSLAVDQGAELKFSADADPSHNAAIPIFKVGDYTWWAAPSGASPTFSGSPGDIAWVPQSASTAIWVNVSDGISGSKWTALSLDDEGSQTTGAK